MAVEIIIIQEILQKTIVLYFGIALGIIWIKSPLKKFKTHFVSITINIFTPFLIILSLIKLDFDSYWFYPVIAVCLVTIIGLVIPKWIAKSFNQSPPDAAEICTATFPNALNFPFPIIFAFAPESLGIAGLFLATSIIMRNTVGLVISGVKFEKKYIKFLLFPPLVSIPIGFGLNPILQDSSFVSNPIITLVFNIGIIATLMTIGFSIQKPELEYKLPILRTGITRFIVSTMFAIGIIMVFSLPRIVAIPVLVQMIAPPAVYNGLYAEKFNLNGKLTSQVIVTLTFVALILLPIELFLIELLIV